jgi:16S rRNA G966 N2-methylase RsmD
LKETLEFIKTHRFDDVRKLAFASHPAGIDLPFALSQISGRQAIKNKIPSWYENDHIIYPKHLSLEQCSSEATAKYKASLVKGESLVDLTGGFGVDCAFMSQQFKTATYIERSEDLCKIAESNFNELGLNHTQVVCGQAVDHLEKISEVDCVFLDPARRDGVGDKVVAIQDCEPNIIELKEQLLNKAKTVMIKLSPMLDISLALQSLPETVAIHVVSVAGECKELVFVLRRFLAALEMTAAFRILEENRPVPMTPSPTPSKGRQRHSERSEESPEIICINILKNSTVQEFSFLKSKEQQCNINYASKLRKFIYEPNASILKAGAYKSIAHKFNLEKLHPDSHLYTSDQLVENFPGRVFKFVSSFSFNKKEIKENLKNVEQANISIRNFPGSVDELRKKLKLKDGGDIYLFATTLYDGRKVILKVESNRL